MKHHYATKNTCSKEVTFDVEGDRISNISFEGGCNGNLQTISKLLDGLSIDEIEEKCSGIICGSRGTSCADQLATAVRQARDKSESL